MCCLDCWNLEPTNMDKNEKQTNLEINHQGIIWNAGPTHLKCIPSFRQWQYCYEARNKGYLTNFFQLPFLFF